MPDCRLIVLDPITSFLSGRTNLHRDDEVRAALSGLAELARERNLTVVLIAHNRKSSADFAVDAVLGSRGLVLSEDLALRS